MGKRGDYHLNVCLVFRPVNILDVAGADGASGDFGLEFAVGSRDFGEEGVEAGEHYLVSFFFLSPFFLEREGKVQSAEGDTAAIFGFFMRVGLVDMTCCGADSSLLARSRRKLGGRVSESFRGGIFVVCSCGGWWWQSSSLVGLKLEEGWNLTSF